MVFEESSRARSLKFWAGDWFERVSPVYCFVHTVDRSETIVKRTIQVRISKGERLFVAECLDLPVVTQAASLDELTLNIQEAIALHLRGEDLTELGIAANPTILATMELEAVA